MLSYLSYTELQAMLSDYVVHATSLPRTFFPATPAKAGVAGPSQWSGLGCYIVIVVACSSLLLAKTSTSDVGCTGLDWLARAKGSLGWNDEIAASGLWLVACGSWLVDYVRSRQNTCSLHLASNKAPSPSGRAGVGVWKEDCGSWLVACGNTAARHRE